ncbi:MAG: glycosyltransferase family 4 protein [Pseudomonadota bacterium]
MKIVHAITCLLRAGAEENTIQTCNAQAALGHETVLVYGREVDAATLAKVSPAVRTVQVDRMVRPISPLDDMMAVGQLVRTFRALQPDVVHTHNSKAGFLGRLAARLAGVRIIIHGVHILPFLNVSRPRRFMYLAMEKMVAPVTDAFIAVSKGMRDANLAAGLGSDANNHVVYSGMNVAQFQTARPIALPRQEGTLIALTASLEPRKRHSEFLDVFAALKARHPELHLALLGQGALEDGLKAKAAELGLSDAVHFLGFREDVERWIAAADICVLPSMREGLPRVVVQYVAAGKPVVVTQLPGLEEIVEDGVNGFVVASGAVEDMLAPLDQLLSDAGLAARMSAAAAARDVSRWSAERMAPEIGKIILPIAERKGILDDAVRPVSSDPAEPLPSAPNQANPQT